MFSRLMFIVHWAAYLWTIIFAWMIQNAYRKEIDWEIADVADPLTWFLLFAPIIIFHIVDYVITGKFYWNPGKREE